MRRTVLIGVVLLWASLSLAQQGVSIPDEVMEEIKAKDPVSLPRFMTPEERELPPLPVARDRTPPSGAVHCSAEYEPCAGLFMAWESYTDVLTTMTVNITTHDEETKVWMVVDSASEQSSVTSTLTSAGADMDQVEFIVRTTDTVWLRDYGPRFIFEDGVRAIIDHTYNRPRPNDNLLNDYVAGEWGISEYDIPLTHGGGNFHLFSNGDAFMTELVLDENSGLSEQDVIDLYEDYQNVDLTIFPGFPTSFDSTRHIDMWMLPVADDQVIIGEYSSSTGAPYTITENASTTLQSMGYTVFRTPGWSSGGTHYTYTNAVICNDLVFVPQFNSSNDSTAMSVFGQALPTHTLIGVDCSSIITAAGAMHCIVMHVPAYVYGPEPVVKVNQPDGGEFLVVDEQYEITWIAFDDVGVTDVDILLSTDGGDNYDHTIATGENNDGTYLWTVSDLPSTECRVKIVAHDADENTGEDYSDDDFAITASGPEQIYLFDLEEDPGWSVTGSWAWGTPAGAGGAHGCSDPTSGYTGDSVYGYNLSGDYTANLPERHLVSEPIDCSDLIGTQLKFWRWLGVEASIYDHASLSVSNDAATWRQVWENTDEVDDCDWVLDEYDISPYADGQETMYIRWTMGPTDSFWQYCGWNIDDISIWGISTQTQTPGDMNCDDAINFDDIDGFVLALIGEAAYYAEPEYADCNWLDADCDNNDEVNFDDIDPFVNLLVGSAR